ncbi:MAG TPA: hypothetical protein VHL31_12810 [Geminicoccus sp.]|jgi:hypothetical protein|uniref:hypothetical protein n=1 Tax=Geminicoccus sp. TaxID=2024832 RepID=UPI002E30BA83|nr:hypothetical protein [Geminicoccus sp.]HEX2527161.1 hypothetical protein [Geminicoccus sp.]
MEDLINEISTKSTIVEIDDQHRAVLDFGQHSAAKGYLTWRELTHLLDYQSHRPLRHWRRFDEEQVVEATRAAFSRRDEPAKALAHLHALPGLAVPAASAVLAWTDPDHYGAIDQHAWRTLHRFGLVQSCAPGAGLRQQDFVTFTDICRTVSTRLDRPAHWVDLWLDTRARMENGRWH